MRSFDWSATINLKPIEKALSSASHYWRVHDVASGVKLAAEKYEKGEYNEVFFNLIGGVSSLSILIVELFNRKIIEGVPVQQVRLGGGLLGITVYGKKSILSWQELKKSSKKNHLINSEARPSLRRQKLVKDFSGFSMNVTIFVMKIIGLIALTAQESQKRVVQYVVTNKAGILVGCFSVAMLSSLSAHYSQHYTTRFIQLNKKYEGEK